MAYNYDFSLKKIEKKFLNFKRKVVDGNCEQ